MNLILFILGCVLLGLVILSRVPGMDHIVRPVMGMIFKGIEALLENGLIWMITGVKILLFSHVELLRNLVLPPEKIDPTYEVRRKASKSE
jgi:hypothetical protein